MKTFLVRLLVLAQVLTGVPVYGSNARAIAEKVKGRTAHPAETLVELDVLPAFVPPAPKRPLFGDPGVFTAPHEYATFELPPLPTDVTVVEDRAPGWTIAGVTPPDFMQGRRLRGRTIFTPPAEGPPPPTGPCTQEDVESNNAANCPLLTYEQIFGTTPQGFCPPDYSNGGVYMGATPNWGIGLDPTTGIFLVPTNDNSGQRAIGKIVRPATLLSSSVATSLNMGTFSQLITEPTESVWVDIAGDRAVYHDDFTESANTTPTAVTTYIDGGQTRIFGSYQYYYTSGSPDIYPFYTRPFDFTVTGSVVGMDKIPSNPPYDAYWNQRMMSSFCGNVPTEWQSTFGGILWCGNGGTQSVISNQSSGPAMFAFNPAAIGNGIGATTANALLFYPNDHQTLGGWDSFVEGEMFEISTQITGAAMIGGTRTAIFYGSMGTTAACYGVGLSDPNDPRIGTPFPPPDGPFLHCYDPARSGEGQHAYPYVYRIWAYDMNDFRKVKNGITNPGTGQPWKPWEVLPYGFWTVSFPIPQNTVGADVLTRGMQYDQTNKELWLVQAYAGCSGVNVHTFWRFLPTIPEP